MPKGLGNKQRSRLWLQNRKRMLWIFVMIPRQTEQCLELTERLQPVCQSLSIPLAPALDLNRKIRTPQNQRAWQCEILTLSQIEKPNPCAQFSNLLRRTA